MRPSLLPWVLCLMLTSLFALPVYAQSATDLQVEVRVLNQTDSERSSAYWLAFDRVLRRHIETRIRIEPAQREALLKNPSLFVQSFRYRRYDSLADGALLGTRQVREGALPTAVIAVTFPADLAAIIQQQLIPVVEEQEAPPETPVLAMIAVEQQGSQFIIGGERGQKFQARATQLATANNLQLEFPAVEAADLDLISAADILAGDTQKTSDFVAQKYQSDKLLTGALYRLSPSTWQSDWTYSSAGNQAQSFSLTTATLDEALVSAMTQISPNNAYIGSTYSDSSDGAFDQAGVAIRVENIQSLADYDTVLGMLRQLDAGVVTESMEPDTMVFRATDQAAARVRDSLTTSSNFQPLNTDEFAGELSFRYSAR